MDSINIEAGVIILMTVLKMLNRHDYACKVLWRHVIEKHLRRNYETDFRSWGFVVPW
jgi:hypothetical protein